jgi:heme-degrading monooxygenase HmoA
MTFKEEFSEDFEKLFLSVKENISIFPGCMGVELLKSNTTNQKRVYLTRSLWNKEGDLEAYRGSELFATTWKVTKAMFAEKAEAWSTQLVAQAYSDRK